MTSDNLIIGCEYFIVDTGCNSWMFRVVKSKLDEIRISSRGVYGVFYVKSKYKDYRCNDGKFVLSPKDIYDTPELAWDRIIENTNKELNHALEGFDSKIKKIEEEKENRKKSYEKLLTTIEESKNNSTFEIE